jgi:hypothetical protein
MTKRTRQVVLGRPRLPNGLAVQLKALPPSVRGRLVAFIIQAHTEGVDIKELIKSAAELRSLGVLLNQSLRVSKGMNVDTKALGLAAKRINDLWP